MRGSLRIPDPGGELPSEEEEEHCQFLIFFAIFSKFLKYRVEKIEQVRDDARSMQEMGVPESVGRAKSVCFSENAIV